MFFNLFTAMVPSTNVSVTHGTLCRGGRNKVTWRLEQEAGLVPHIWNRSFRSKSTMLKKVLVALLRLFGAIIRIRRSGNCSPLALPHYAPGPMQWPKCLYCYNHIYCNYGCEFCPRQIQSVLVEPQTASCGTLRFRGNQGCYKKNNPKNPLGFFQKSPLKKT